ncbi:MAG: DUF6089 family protein [Bacteroidia bacterium]
MNARTITFLLYLVFATISCAFGQRTHALSVGLGTIYYYGDLTDNFNNSLLKPAVSLSYSKYIVQQLSFRVNMTMGQIGAYDNVAFDRSRVLRNLHFKSNLYELSGNIVYEFLPDKNFGNAWQGKPHWSPYIFGGIAFFRFNPKAILNNQWYELQPLGTEGQFIPGNAGPYSLVQASVPVGLGASVRISERAGINFEIGYRTTFTDYLDDISTVYPDFEALAEVSGPLAVELSERSVGNIFRPGEKRGNSDANDSYFFTMVSVTYYLSRYASRDNN